LPPDGDVEISVKRWRLIQNGEFNDKNGQKDLATPPSVVLQIQISLFFDTLPS
jgi:hypothetical protein